MNTAAPGQSGCRGREDPFCTPAWHSTLQAESCWETASPGQEEDAPGPTTKASPSAPPQPSLLAIGKLSEPSLSHAGQNYRGEQNTALGFANSPTSRALALSWPDLWFLVDAPSFVWSSSAWSLVF